MSARASELSAITYRVIGAAIEVHQELGPGLLESAYEQSLAWELRSRGIAFERQVVIPMRYKGLELRSSYRVDFVVAGRVAVELKAVDHTTALHHAQMLTYLRLLPARVGLLINFRVPVLHEGVHRKVL